MTSDGIYTVAEYIQYTGIVIILNCSITEYSAPLGASQSNIHIYRPTKSS